MHAYPPPIRRGFTLIEIMIVVAIIAMLAAIATSNVIRARKRAQAAKTLDDLRTIDGALDQYALEHNKQTGDGAMFSDLHALHEGNEQARSARRRYFWANLRTLFRGYSTQSVGFHLQRLLSDVAPAEFWSPYK